MTAPYIVINQLSRDLAAAEAALEQHRQCRSMDGEWWTELRELIAEVTRLRRAVRELISDSGVA